MTEETLVDELGHDVAAIVSVPREAKAVVVLSHGFTSNKDSPSYRILEQRLNEKSIGTVRYDYYGHGPLYVGAKRYGVRSDVTLSKTVASLRAVIRHLRSVGDYRIGLFGSSFGGLVSLVTATEDPHISALVLKSPVTEPVRFWKGRVGETAIENWIASGVLHYAQGVEQYDLDIAFWRDVLSYDTLNAARAITCPTMIIHGDADDVVPIAQSRTLAGILGTEVHVVNGANHFYDQPQHTQQMKELAISFLTANLI